MANATTDGVSRAPPDVDVPREPPSQGVKEPSTVDGLRPGLGIRERDALTLRCKGPTTECRVRESCGVSDLRFLQHGDDAIADAISNHGELNGSDLAHVRDVWYRLGAERPGLRPATFQTGAKPAGYDQGPFSARVFRVELDAQMP